jgi:hypothetical protein
MKEKRITKKEQKDQATAELIGSLNMLCSQCDDIEEFAEMFLTITKQQRFKNVDWDCDELQQFIKGFIETKNKWFKLCKRINNAVASLKTKKNNPKHAETKND